jgi:hypothetical protein
MEIVREEGLELSAYTFKARIIQCFSRYFSKKAWPPSDLLIREGIRKLARLEVIAKL